jgi:hypothetical protein
MDSRHDAQRAADQVDRQINQQQRTAELVQGLGAKDPTTAEPSERTLSAMTAPPHDETQITAMTDTRDDAVQPTRRRRWWRRLLGRR